METLKHRFLCYSQVIQPKPVAALGLWNQSFLIAQQLLHARTLSLNKHKGKQLFSPRAVSVTRISPACFCCERLYVRAQKICFAPRRRHGRNYIIAGLTQAYLGA